MANITSQEAKLLYDSFGSIYSPALKENVDFDNYGWRHLRFDGHGHKRNKEDIGYRLRLLPFIPEVIKNCKAVVSSEERFIYLNGILRNVTFFELCFVCKIPGRKTKRVEIVVRKFEVGSPHFYSIRNKR